jgi:hypothetical protein
MMLIHGGASTGEVSTIAESKENSSLACNSSYDCTVESLKAADLGQTEFRNSHDFPLPTLSNRNSLFS